MNAMLGSSAISTPFFVILDKIKLDARLWVLAGARKLGSSMPGK
jgi:hypothetical protein